MTRVAIYNRFWSTMGGGERYAAMLGSVLAERADVELVGHEELALDEIAARLAVDLSRVRFRQIPGTTDFDAEPVSKDYDLWITASHSSRMNPRAKRSAYVCWFPTPVTHTGTVAQRMASGLVRAVSALPTGDRSWRRSSGWFRFEGNREARWTWTSGTAKLMVDPGEELTLSGKFSRGALPPTTLRISDSDGSELQTFRVGSDWKTKRFVVPPSSEPTTVYLTCDAVNPGGGERRHLGVCVRSLHAVRNRGLRERVVDRYNWRASPRDLGHVGEYDVVLAISDFTRRYIRRWWAAEAEIIYPSIPIGTIVPTREREPVILSVGRFFPPSAGHSKRQLEMVQVFATLVASGHLAGWRLVLIGGCSEAGRPYLEEVRAAAEGLPVDIHENAPRELVVSALSTASIFWSATGLGANSRREPWKSEHFGMTTVEAMAAGCVPVVIDRAGQREIVRQGVDGLRWRNRRQWQSQTLRVAADPELRQRLAAAAIERAFEYSDAVFAERVSELVDRYDLLAESASV